MSIFSSIESIEILVLPCTYLFHANSDSIFRFQSCEQGQFPSTRVRLKRRFYYLVLKKEIFSLVSFNGSNQNFNKQIEDLWPVEKLSWILKIVIFQKSLESWKICLHLEIWGKQSIIILKCRKDRENYLHTSNWWVISLS